MSLKVSEKVVVQRPHFPQLFENLVQQGYQIVGPTVQDKAIVYAELESPDELPEGWADEQNNAFYRLKKREDKTLFSYVVGPHSWKNLLFPSNLQMWRTDAGLTSFEESSEPPPKYAFLGVRACELHAMQIQDKVFLQGSYADSDYRKKRENLFIVAVNCTQPGGTCFCSSMQTGPQVESGFDIALTEVCEGALHYFVAEAGSESGLKVLQQLPHETSSPTEIEKAASLVKQAGEQMGRTLDTEGLKELLYRNTENSRWEEVANRCLTCANCTMVCPTCFCSRVEDVTDLDGAGAERWRKWDSCFTVEYSYIKGGAVRPSVHSRYRQWLTHKLGAWYDQFGTSGCVGCGRCITWCPVGIDLTEEARAIRQSELSR
ncbi:MAG: 4Fe-4S dicluster domain-containing protein [Chloroflexi bacterium]|uniref:4Fe-4S dicluster domain-containing protein n=1 Tax=Candidatus Chlorohelix allophototropha TaxID=3003348 RepID=A0A8T7LYF8_9CHLR|nr:4Fe-4S dicluster domain-containing protein [Chloroflexota bacterium]WJW66263.1 4Fe-4S dicluster domain-containing protein [Chloroflexota bacterium L227-S17]